MATRKSNLTGREAVNELQRQVSKSGVKAAEDKARDLIYKTYGFKPSNPLPSLTKGWKKSK